MADVLHPTAWSETDAANGSGTQPSFPENMPGRDLNNACRAMMGALKRAFNQINATITSTNAGNAYTLAYSVAPDIGSPYPGQRFTWKANAPNTGAATVQINATGAKPLKKITSGVAVDLISGDIGTNSIIDMVYIAALGQFLWINAPTSSSGTVPTHTHPDLAPLISPAFTGIPTAPTATTLTSTTQIATTAFVTSAVAAATSSGGGIITKSASGALVITDANNLVSMDVASANTLTIPANATVAFPINTEIDIVQHGAGQTTLLAAGGVTLRASGNKLKLTAQYSGATIKKRGTDDWYVWGDLSA